MNYEERRDRNERSRQGAEKFAQPWGHDELELLMLWDGTEAELGDLAEMLGRTIEACRQKFYTSQRGTVTVTETETHTKTRTTVYRGWMESDGDGWD